MTLEETARSTVRSAMDQGSETMEQAGQAAKGAYQAAQQFAENERPKRDLAEFVHREPWLAVAAAFAIGYLAAQMLRRGS